MRGEVVEPERGRVVDQDAEDPVTARRIADRPAFFFGHPDRHEARDPPIVAEDPEGAVVGARDLDREFHDPGEDGVQVQLRRERDAGLEQRPIAVARHGCGIERAHPSRVEGRAFSFTRHTVAESRRTRPGRAIRPVPARAVPPSLSVHNVVAQGGVIIANVREVMTEAVVTATEDSTFKELVRLMRAFRVSAIPIVRDGRVVGLVSEADLIVKRDPDLLEWHLWEGPHRRKDRRKAAARVAADLMSAPAVTIGPDATVSHAAHVLRERGFKHLPVADQAGRLLGIVSRVDLLLGFLRDDDAIGDDVATTLTARLPDPATVRAAVCEGVVRLEGNVALRTEATRLIDRVRSLEGVVAVDAEQLEWETDDTVEPASAVPWVGF
jgi:CBS domain-containing protein